MVEMLLSSGYEGQFESLATIVFARCGSQKGLGPIRQSVFCFESIKVSMNG